MIRYKFSQQTGKDFAITLKQRVNAYFLENALSKHATSPMVVKTILAISFLIIPYVLMLLGGFTSLLVLFSLWIAMGFAKAMIGTSVMHDALHGSYSGNKSVNLLMSLSAVGIGVDPNIWKIQHNVLHHTYTNIDDADEDIHPRYVMRFSPHQPKKWFHRYQYIYALFFYGISTLMWVGYKDFYKLVNYRKRGLIQPNKPFRALVVKVVFRKIMYYFLFLALPMIVLPIPIWQTLLMFVAMHVVTGILLSLIFQTAHVMPTSAFIAQEEKQINQNWFIHQLNTTTNYAMNNRFISWCFGGLNHQVEHHLFPNICHVHYPKIAPIVQQTATEFSLPYYAEKSLPSAVINHFRMLKMLGRPE